MLELGLEERIASIVKSSSMRITRQEKALSSRSLHMPLSLEILPSPFLSD